MNQKTFELKLVITVDEVSINCPSGTYWSFPAKELPDLLHRVAARCLLDDAELDRSMAARLEVRSADDGK